MQPLQPIRQPGHTRTVRWRASPSSLCSACRARCSASRTTAPAPETHARISIIHLHSPPQGNSVSLRGRERSQSAVVGLTSSGHAGTVLRYFSMFGPSSYVEPYGRWDLPLPGRRARQNAQPPSPLGTCGVSEAQHQVWRICVNVRTAPSLSHLELQQQQVSISVLSAPSPPAALSCALQVIKEMTMVAGVSSSYVPVIDLASLRLGSREKKQAVAREIRS